ncbi:hypothetical protein BOQ63_006685 (plasmid) [Streptomyces viridifaciens]|nr:hypothetical protein CP971_33865 [Streptomyces viridifaciens]UKZ03760.1 hypothetical protein BOQ63_006685 [Streptomyces viridifaciens]
MKRLGWVAAVLATAAAVSGCGGGGGQGMTGPGQAGQQVAREDADQPRPYRLTLPESLGHGRYAGSHDAAPVDPRLAQVMADQIEGATAVFGWYQSAPKDRDGALAIGVTGLYGTVRSPATALEQFQSVLDGRDNVQGFIVGPRSITPPRSREPLRCRIVLVRTGGVDFRRAECSWADASAVVVVSEPLREAVRPESVDLDALAAEVAAVREDVRAPAS